jgi:hypothetical protein
VRSKDLFGADGARSQIITGLGLSLNAQPSKGVAINVLVAADLTKHIKTRMGNLHFVLQPDKPHPKFGWLSIARMLKPWHEWMFILFPHKSEWRLSASMEEYAEHVRSLIGGASISVDVTVYQPGPSTKSSPKITRLETRKV